MGPAETASGLTPALEARDLAVRRGDTVVVRAAGLRVPARETLVIVGPNGSGKTSLLLALALLIDSEGEIRFNGEVARDPVAQRRRMAVVLQRPLLLDRSVLDNAALGMALRGVERSERERRAREWLARFGVGHLAARQARTLSGGESQRVSLARGFALRPDLLFLDEPFGALDAPSREAIVADTARLLAETRTSAVVVTHDRDEAASLGDSVAVVIDGTVRQVGPPDAVFRTPADMAVASFVGVETILPAHVVSSDDELTVLRVGDRLVEVTATPPPGDDFPLLCIGPEDVTISLERDAISSVRNRFAATVTNVEPIGRRVRIVLDCGFPLVAHVTRASARDLALAPGVAVTASFEATAPHLLPRRRPPQRPATSR